MLWGGIASSVCADRNDVNVVLAFQSLYRLILMKECIYLGPVFCPEGLSARERPANRKSRINITRMKHRCTGWRTT